MFKALHKIIFKKVLNHNPDLEGQQSWIKENTSSSPRGLSIIHKRTSHSSPQGVVILCHPFRVESKDFFLQNGHADLYLDIGWHVVTFDFNGYGLSPLNQYAYDLDILELVRFARNRYTGHKIAVHGISFGAAQLIRALSHKNHGISYAIVENSLTKYYHYFKNRKPLVYVLIRLLTPFFRSMNNENNYLKKISTIQDINHVLLIYGKKDELTTLEMGKQLQEACNVNCELIVYDCGHMKAIETAYTDYQALIKDYIES